MTDDDRLESPVGAAPDTLETATEVESPEGTGDLDAPGAGPSLRAVGIWILLTIGAVALDGIVGGLTMVVIAAFVLARLSTRWLGAIGVAALVAVPIVVIVRGLPTNADLSPAFVYESLIPHHLTFVGLVLTSACALFDLAPHLEGWSTAKRVPTWEGPPLGPVLGAVAVGVIAVAAWLACSAVLSG